MEADPEVRVAQVAPEAVFCDEPVGAADVEDNKLPVSYANRASISHVNLTVQGTPTSS